MSTLEAGPRLNKWGVERDKKLMKEREDKQQRANNDPANTFKPALVAKQPHGLATDAVNRAAHQRLFDIAEEQRKDLKRQQQDEVQRLRQAEIAQCTFQPALRTRNSAWYREATSFRDSFFSSRQQPWSNGDDASVSTSQSEVYIPATPATSEAPKRWFDSLQARSIRNLRSETPSARQPRATRRAATVRPRERRASTPQRRARSPERRSPDRRSPDRRQQSSSEEEKRKPRAVSASRPRTTTPAQDDFLSRQSAFRDHKLRHWQQLREELTPSFAPTLVAEYKPDPKAGPITPVSIASVRGLSKLLETAPAENAPRKVSPTRGRPTSRGSLTAAAGRSRSNPVRKTSPPRRTSPSRRVSPARPAAARVEASASQYRKPRPSAAAVVESSASGVAPVPTPTKSTVTSISERALFLEQERERLGLERMRIENELRNLRQGIDSGEPPSEEEMPNTSEEARSSSKRPFSLEMLQAYLVGRIDDESDYTSPPKAQPRATESGAASATSSDTVEADADFRRRTAGAAAGLFGADGEEFEYHHLPSKRGHLGGEQEPDVARTESPPPEPREALPPPPSPVPNERTSTDPWERLLPLPPSGQDDDYFDNVATRELVLAAHQRATQRSKPPGSIIAVHSDATSSRAMSEATENGGESSGEGWSRLSVADKSSRDAALRTFHSKLIEQARASMDSQATLQRQAQTTQYRASSPARTRTPERRRPTPQEQLDSSRRLSTPRRRYPERRGYNELEPTGMFSSTNLLGRQTTNQVFGTTQTRSTPPSLRPRINALTNFDVLREMNIYNAALTGVMARREEEQWSANHPMAMTQELFAKRNPAAAAAIAAGASAAAEGAVLEGADAAEDAIVDGAAAADGSNEEQQQIEAQQQQAPRSNFLSPTKASSASAWNFVRPPEEKRELKYMIAASQEMIAAKGEFNNHSMIATAASKEQKWEAQKKKDNAPRPNMGKLQYQAEHSKVILDGKETVNGYMKPTSAAKLTTWADHNARKNAQPQMEFDMKYMAAHSKELLDGKEPPRVERATKTTQLKKQIGPAATKYDLVDTSKISGRNTSARTRGFRLDKHGDGDTRKLA